jgi:major histocompatibility complex class I
VCGEVSESHIAKVSLRLAIKLMILIFLKKVKPGMVVHTFNPRTWEAEAGGFLSWRPAWSTK